MNNGGSEVTDFDDRERAVEPEDLGRLFLERANARDIEGVVALYEPDAVLASAGGDVVTGSEAIRVCTRRCSLTRRSSPMAYARPCATAISL